MEAKRIFDVLDKRLADNRFLAGEQYTIADIANFGWAHYFVSNDAYQGATKFLDMPSYKNLARWEAEIAARVPVQRGLRVNLPVEGYAQERHSAADIDAVME